MLALGLLISTLTRNQFAASQAALIVGFLPAFELSGFIFEIDSMPAPIRLLTCVLPPRYFVVEPADTLPGRRRAGGARARTRWSSLAFAAVLFVAARPGHRDAAGVDAMWPASGRLIVKELLAVCATPRAGSS